MEFVNSMHRLFGFDRDNPVLFNSGLFLLFFTVFISVYAFIYKKRFIRTVFVILFSLFIYYKISGWFLLVLLLTATIDYILALLIQKSGKKIHKKIFLALSLCASLGLLIYFKYTNFFIENLYSLSGDDFKPFNIILPIGISFYTFRTISYMIDVYREEIKAEKKFLHYIFYMTYFPMLIAGPITRAKDFLPRLKKAVVIKQFDISKGLFLIMQGLIKKAVIADYLGQYNDLVFSMPESYSGFENLMAVYGFAIQLYFDFSGYTDMAMGLAKIMGFNIDQNFNKPYHALNVTDFWRRWHITLSSWLRDYLFSPLSLKLRNFRKAGIIASLMITFLLCGLWHGPSWTFVVWGGLQGLAMTWDVLIAKRRNRLKKKIRKPLYNFFSWIITFHLIIFMWVFFRAQDFQTAFTMYGRVFTDMDWAFVGPFLNVRGLFVILLLLSFAIYAIPLKWFSKISQQFINTPFWVKIILFLLVIQLIIQLQSANVQPFIYAQF
ncbi:MAG: MBOAT family O-acyltransferase [Bacteroidota bacterium]